MKRIRFVGWLWKRWRDRDGALLKYHRDNRREEEESGQKTKGWKVKGIWDAEGIFQTARYFCTQISVRDNEISITARMDLENIELIQRIWRRGVLISGVMYGELRPATENKNQLMSVIRGEKDC